MVNDKLIHDLIVDQLTRKLARDYKDIRHDPSGSPDLTLSNHGLVMAMVVVETSDSMTPERADMWKAILQPGVKLILMVPKASKVKATELLWQKGLSISVSVGTYEISLNLP